MTGSPLVGGSKYVSGSKFVSWHPASIERMLKTDACILLVGILRMRGKMCDSNLRMKSVLGVDLFA